VLFVSSWLDFFPGLRVTSAVTSVVAYTSLPGWRLLPSRDPPPRPCPQGGGLKQGA
jgi:hypothetical protein